MNGRTGGFISRWLGASVRRFAAAALVIAAIEVAVNLIRGGSYKPSHWVLSVFWGFLPLPLVWWSRILSYLYVTFFLFWSTAFIYYQKILSMDATAELLEAMFNTNISEVMRVTSARGLVIFFVLLAATLAVMRLLEKRMPATVSAVVMVMVLAGLYPSWVNYQRFGYLGHMFPGRITDSLREYIKARRATITLMEGKKRITDGRRIVYNGPSDLKVIMVKGESARARNFSLLGYGRPTDPELSRMENIVPMPNVFSFENNTARAVPYMFTRATRDDAAPTAGESSVISVFRAAGFRTRWVGADWSNFSTYASPIVAIAEEAEESAFLGDIMVMCRRAGGGAMIGGCGFDSKSFMYARDALMSKGPGPSFTVIEMDGSHIPYTAPEEFERFKPGCGKGVESIAECSRDMVVNDYDNTILYMDYLLSELIKSLREGTAVVFFFSDHGQSLGENGQYGHGYLVAERYKDSPEQRNAAAFAWMSPSARKAFPEAFAHMAANGGKFMGHDVIFHSLLGCVGVKTDLAVQGRNFCGPEFVEDSWLKERYGGGR